MDTLYWFKMVVTDPGQVFYEPPSAEKNMAILAAAAMSEDTKPVPWWKRVMVQIEQALEKWSRL